MKNKIISLIVLSIFQSIIAAGEPNEQTQIKGVIEKLNLAAGNLKNLSAKIEYTHAQPLFDTQTIRDGKIFYVKDANCSALRINFLTLKQDQSKKQNYKEDYIFDGTKLTKIDYQTKSAATELLAEEEPIEPFELVQDYFPIIGLTKNNQMAEQFDITAVQNTLFLKPKEKSRFFKTYKEIEIKIDPDNNLPFDFSAITAEDEQITIKLSQIDTSKVIKKSVFNVIIPADFAQMKK
ncbi:MAG: outer-membrane lipoprotein carrier protein LolA [Phycisphaerae bacterium]|nr:outer-membrane lipoprotein carrier protein LolA [Phycisphaerae bacterium]